MDYRKQKQLSHWTKRPVSEATARKEKAAAQKEKAAAQKVMSSNTAPLSIGMQAREAAGEELTLGSNPDAVGTAAQTAATEAGASLEDACYLYQMYFDQAQNDSTRKRDIIQKRFLSKKLSEGIESLSMEEKIPVQAYLLPKSYNSISFNDLLRGTIQLDQILEPYDITKLTGVVFVPFKGDAEKLYEELELVVKLHRGTKAVNKKNHDFTVSRYMKEYGIRNYNELPNMDKAFFDVAKNSSKFSELRKVSDAINTPSIRLQSIQARESSHGLEAAEPPLISFSMAKVQEYPTGQPHGLHKDAAVNRRKQPIQARRCWKEGWHQEDRVVGGEMRTIIWWCQKDFVMYMLNEAMDSLHGAANYDPPTDENVVTRSGEHPSCCLAMDVVINKFEGITWQEVSKKYDAQSLLDVFTEIERMFGRSSSEE